MIKMRAPVQHLPREVQMPSFVVRIHPVYVSHCYGCQGERHRVYVDRAGWQSYEHGVTNSGHAKQDGHLQPPKAQEAEDDPDRSGENVAQCDIGLVIWSQTVAVQGAKRIPKRYKGDVTNLKVKVRRAN